MIEAALELAEGKLTAIEIDFAAPDWCEFEVFGCVGRFRAPRRMIRGVNSSSVVVVAYLREPTGVADVVGMIVNRCGRPPSLRDREILREAASRHLRSGALAGAN